MDEPLEEPSTLTVERWLLGDLSPEESAAVEQALGAERARVLRAEDAALRERLAERLPAERFAERVRSAAEPEARSRLALRGWLLPAFAALAGVLLVVVRPPQTPEPHASQQGAPAATERRKGLDLELRVYRKRGETVERLEDGAESVAGDMLQLAYLRAGYKHAVLLSVDGRGQVTLHYPREPDGSTALGATGGEQLVPEAYELDDAPGFERFILVASAAPLDVEAVLREAERLAGTGESAMHAPLELSVPTAQRSLLLRKRGASP